MDQTSKVRKNRQSIEAEERTQKEKSFKEAFTAILPKDFQTVLQAIVTMACLYQFLQTKDAVWVLTAYALASGSVSLPIERTLLSNKKVHLRKEDKF
jgi:ABC-type transport system involved in cytochrome c biogenesis permease component